MAIVSILSLRSAVEKAPTWAKDGILILLGSFLLSFSSLFSWKIPFTTIPIAIAAQISLGLGAVLGKRRGTLAVLAFLAQGAVGFPVFALRSGGFWHLLGPSGGYLFGYAVGAYVVGWLVEKTRSSSFLSLFSLFMVGNIAVFGFGVLQLSYFVGWHLAFSLGVYPFLLGDLFKTIALTQMVSWVKR